MTFLSHHQISSCIAEVKQGNTPLGLKILESALDHPNHPEVKAWYGYCLAREKNQFNNAIELCKDALRTDPREADIYLALSRIYILLNNREMAVDTLRLGAKMDHSQENQRLLETLGIRKQPVFPFLRRRNLINVASGRLLSKMGFRKAQ